MSKSKCNVVSPEEIISKYGADTARLFILFAAPPERDLEWSDQGVEGAYRFLGRVWRIVYQLAEKVSLGNETCDANELTKNEKDLRRVLHATIKKVTDDIGLRFNFNTAISSIMELVNAIYTANDKEENLNQDLVREVVSALLKLLAPFAPHMTEELWSEVIGTGSVHKQCWPKFDEKAVVLDEVEVVLQINGKVRDKIVVPAGLNAKGLEEKALEQQKVKDAIEGKTIVKVICVPNKLVNVVVK